MSGRQRDSRRTPQPTRGMRQLQQFLGEEEAQLLRPKTAKDLVPLLQADHKGKDPVALLTDAVLAHMEHCRALGSASQLSGKQMKAVQFLATTPRAEAEADAAPIIVKRVVLDAEPAQHCVAVGALQRAARTASLKSPSDGRCVFVLVETNEEATKLANWLQGHYELEVVRADSADAAAFPVVPGSASSAGPGQRGRSRSESSTAPPSSSWRVPVFVASPDGFLAIDQRSALWRCVGVFVHFLSAKTKPFATLPMGSAEDKAQGVASLTRLSKHRWSCLGHVPLTCVLAPTSACVSSPRLDWLTTVRPSTGAEKTAAPMTSRAQPRKEVQVHYHVLEGLQRVQFLYALLHSLQKGRGMLVRVATKEMCSFLYDVLYRFLDALPPHLRLMSDYEGESTYSATQSSEDRLRLATSFDEMVEEGKLSPVLLSCFGVVPLRGSIFVQFDIIVDLPNFSQFLAEKLTPGAVQSKSNAEVVRNTVSRKRSRSPVPLSGRSGSPPPVSGSASASQSSAVTSEHAGKTACNYSFLFILLRPAEVNGALQQLRHTGTRHALCFTPLHTPPPLNRYLFVGEKIRSMHRKLFVVQNAAYHAYKATMVVYCTVGPREVYDESRLDLLKVAEEFGYVDLPLLDLRLKDTPFRPKEDYIKASRVKMSKEKRALREFTSTHIQGEGPAPLGDLDAAGE